MYLDTRGYAKIKKASAYMGISERTFRELLKNGLRHIRLPSGTILVSYAAIDEYLVGFEVHKNQVDEIVNELMQEL